MKKISPTLHGYIDYVTVVLFLISPTLIGMTGKAMATTASNYEAVRR